jgi:ubiquinone biosynthesis protein
MSEKTEAFELQAFRHEVGQLVASRLNQGLKDLNVGGSLMEVSRFARENGLFVPSELTLLGKTLLELDDVGRILDPNFDTNASVRRNAGDITTRRLGRESTQGSVVNALLEMKDFTVNLPARLNRIMDAVANAELEVKVRVPESKMLVESIEKVANRITNGIILASLIIGASLMMRIDTPWHLFGYPGLAIICFIFGAGGACILFYNVIAQDRRSRKSRHR